jgi:hypothetical protein
MAPVFCVSGRWFGGFDAAQARDMVGDARHGYWRLRRSRRLTPQPGRIG